MAHDAAGDNRYTHGMAEFIAGLRYERIPAEVLAPIKRLDSLGRAIYGACLLAIA
jgi:hypothetical protein